MKRAIVGLVLGMTACVLCGCVSVGHGGAGIFIGGAPDTNGNYSIGAYSKNNTATNVWKISGPIDPASAIKALFGAGL